MRRRVFTIAAAVSLALCVASIAAWIRGQSHLDTLPYSTETRDTGIISGGGMICAHTESVFLISQPRNWYYVDAPMVSGYDLHFSFDFFGLRYGDFRFGIQRKFIGAPHWFLVLMFAVLPAVWIWRSLRRVEPGKCVKCGYDMRATPTRCPECGTEPTGDTIAAR